MQSKNEFIAIIREHEGLIYKVAKVYTDDKDDEQDLYQEIVYQLWKSFDSFKNEAKISTWMYYQIIAVYLNFQLSSWV